MIRLFVAIDLPETVRLRLGALRGGLPGARWVAGENMHVTLRFIGEVAYAQAREIDGELAAIRDPCFDIQLDDVGFFGKPRAARAVWAGVRPCESLSRLRRKVDAAVARAGVAPEGRKFSPHVTLARLKRSPPERLERFVAEHAGFRAPAVPVERFLLYSSHLAPAGAEHMVEAEYPLTG